MRRDGHSLKWLLHDAGDTVEIVIMHSVRSHALRDYRLCIMRYRLCITRFMHYSCMHYDDFYCSVICLWIGESLFIVVTGG
jgi:hypothetical protein